jgi:hypothetical protein
MQGQQRFGLWEKITRLIEKYSSLSSNFKSYALHVLRLNEVCNTDCVETRAVWKQEESNIDK